MKSELDSLNPEMALTDEQKVAKEAELEELKKTIAESKKQKGRSFLGKFKPGQIKGELINKFASLVGRMASRKDEVNEGLSAKLEDRVINAQNNWNTQQGVRREAANTFNTATESFDKTEIDLENAEIYADKKDRLDSKSAKYEERIRALEKELEAQNLKSLNRQANVVRLFNGLAKGLNKLDLKVRGVLTGTTPNLDNVEGITQGEVLNVRAVKDVQQLSEDIQQLKELADEGIDISSRISEIEERQSNLSISESNYGSLVSNYSKDISAKKEEINTVENEKRDSRQEHRATVADTVAQNKERIKSGEDMLVVPTYDPSSFNERIDNLDSQISGIKASQADVLLKLAAVQKENRSLAQELQLLKGKQKVNTELSRDLTEAVSRINGKYESLDTNVNNPATNPFGVTMPGNMPVASEPEPALLTGKVTEVEANVR
ncbi:MAG: hypothetical protein PHD02_01245 [Bacilli bacterium]|nr:hypothetical protein [Bacilli bacterium]